MRLGFVLAGAAALPAAEFAGVVRETEARGYHTAWTGETGGYDAIAIMATMLAQSSTLHVGSAVMPVQTRTPTQEFATIWTTSQPAVCIYWRAT